MAESRVELGADQPLNVIGPDGAGEAGPGYDHGWFDFTAAPAREPVRWPGDARLAVCVVITLSAVEWERDAGEPDRFPIRPPGGRGIAPYPDFPRMSHREFGHRVGVFRLLDLASACEIPLAASVDLLTARHYPALRRHLVSAVDELIAGGLSASRPITSRMSEDEERDYLEFATEGLSELLGTRPSGWLGPEHSESHRTPRLLAQAGFDYVLDWGNDEVPYPMTGALGSRESPGLWSFPLSWELSDLDAMFLRQVRPEDYARSVTDAITRMAEEPGRVLGLHLHPWLSGQAFRAGAIREVFQRLRDQHVWLATPSEVVRWYREQRGSARPTPPPPTAAAEYPGRS